MLLLCASAKVSAQEKQRQDELKKERTIRGNRFKVFNNYVNFYSDTEFKKVTKIKVKNLIYKYKNHPSLLMWNIGNESTYPLPINNKRKKFINFFNELIDLIHEEDKNHPVSTTLEGPFMKQAFKINRFSPNIDLIGYNVFSMIEKVKLNQNKLSYITSTVPYFISEWGVNGPWEASKNNWMAILEQPSTEKGAEYKDVYNKYIKNKMLFNNLKKSINYAYLVTRYWY